MDRLEKIKNRVTEDVEYEDAEWLIETVEQQQKEIERLKTAFEIVSRENERHRTLAYALKDVFETIE